MYRLNLKVSKINDKNNIIFISPVTLTSNFDVTFNKCNAGQGCVSCVWLFPCNDSKKVVVEAKYYLSPTLESPTYLSTLSLAQFKYSSYFGYV